MGKLVMNGKLYSGSSNYASAINYTEEDGRETTVQNKIEEINSNLSANGIQFRFGVNESGEYGYIVTDSEGADTVVPFSGKYKNVIVDSLANTNKGLTYDSSWEEIAQAINELFPDQLNLLSEWGVSEIYKIPQWWDEPITWYSQDFDVTNFSTLHRSVTQGWTSGSGEKYGVSRCYLIVDKGDGTTNSISLIGSGGVDLTPYSGMARIQIQVGGAKPWSSSNSTTRGWVRISSLVLYA